MKKYFKQENGDIIDLIEHCSEILGKYHDAEILIGTDSQNGKKKRGGNTHYVTVVVFRYGYRGAHFIYQKSEVPKIRDIFKRLFKECELSVEVANYLNENTSYKIKAIELDFNDFKKTESTPLIAGTKGWCESLGYKVMLKSGDMYACKAADHVLRHPGLYK